MFWPSHSIARGRRATSQRASRRLGAIETFLVGPKMSHIGPVPPRRHSLTAPKALSARQRELHHHSRQAKKHSHSPTSNLWRHGIACNAHADRLTHSEGSCIGATHATPRLMGRALDSWGLPARGGPLKYAFRHSLKSEPSGLIACAIAA